uniref:Uncharacterized protein n=1 Tax=Fagus sylvatica TaxID=28930 RepID=A0A2N9F0P7_FAGSY
MLLSLRRLVDRFIWASTKKGVFTVKSAYQLQMAAQHSGEGSSSNSASSSSCIWRALWSTLVQPKVKTLLSPSLEIMFYTAWGLWKARNVLYWEQKVMGVDDICQLATRSAIDFLELVGIGVLIRDSFGGVNAVIQRQSTLGVIIF